eukprot:CAMPEP_0115723746 /NCGR_PEP_ID=MMETSP0272-20121206/80404_1 /TAXON_ID=71861 /ORGANISM="Scrippsiella trochoidea, Strain CCMP3099" /LENGTH=273 /DNA_ID=CAMNT_0003166913 /DNA_START=1 /DNA_END=820 /DNA_ORIENTATION=+
MTVTGGLRRRLRTKVRVDYPVPAASRGEKASLASSTPAGGTANAAGARYGEFVLKDKNPEYVIVRAALDAEMLARLNAFLNRKRPQPAKMKNEGGNSDDERKARYDDRDSLVSWFTAQDECPWLQDRFAAIIKDVANVEWPLLKVSGNGELQCEYEETQYAVYGPGQHFKAWHQDAFAEGNDPEDARQFTIVAMLTPRSNYTGGAFQAKLEGPVKDKKVIRNLSLDAGDCLVFPAKQLCHRVSAVKTAQDGAWCSGPLTEILASITPRVLVLE